MKSIANEGSCGAAWWGFAPGLLLTFGVGFVIMVFDPLASFPFVKICLWLLHSQIRVAYSHLRERHSTLILPLPLLCVHNNTTLVPALRIAWFINLHPPNQLPKEAVLGTVCGGLLSIYEADFHYCIPR